MNRYAAALGYALTLVALAFFARQLWLERAALHVLLSGDRGLIAAFSASALLFAAIYPLTALVSARMLRDLGHPLSAATLIGVLGVSQLARYIPGNVGQHIARGSMLGARGVPMPAVVASLGYEALLAFLAAATIAAAALLWEGSADRAQAAIMAIALILLLAGGILLLPRLAARLPVGRIHRLLDALHGVSHRTQLLCFAVYAINCWLVGLGLALIAWALPGTAPTGVAHYVGAFAVAWTAGFLIPGLPAGLGMRESVLIVLLAPSIGMASAVALATLHRLSTTAGDLVAAAAGFALLRRERANAAIIQPQGGSADET
jgi:hypothetical protein